MTKNKLYLAFDGINGEYEEFDTIEEAREWLEESFMDSKEGYHPDAALCLIYKLEETVVLSLADKQENYKYITEEDVPEDSDEECWPYPTQFDEIWTHKWVKQENIEKDLNFLKEMREHITKGNTEMALEMIDDWIEELKRKQNG